MKTTVIFGIVLLSLVLPLALRGARAQENEITIELHIIGFSVDAQTEQQLREMAEAGNGQYYSAESEAELDTVLGEALGVGTAPALSQESEPNNSFGTANMVAAKGEVEATINPQRDADWYRLQVDHQGQLQVLITNVPTELDVVVRAWNANKDAITRWFAPLRAGGDTQATIDLPEKGAYYLEVRDSHDDARAIEPYSLQLVFTATVDQHEPNDSFGKASPIALNQTIQANILPQRDADWYKLEADHQGELQVLITNVPAKLDVVVRAWNANKDAITRWFGPLRAGGETQATIDLPEKGAYYLEVRDSHDDARAIEPYSLQLTFTPTADDQHEPNNSFGTASPIALNQTIKANILPQRDADWYKLEVDHQGELQVLITDVPAELDVVVRAWNANKDAITRWFAPLRAGGDTQATIDLPEKGEYYLEVRDSHDDQRSIQPYTLKISFKSL